MTHARNFIDLTGQKIHRLTFLEYAGKADNGCARWKVRCDCGEIFEVTATSVKCGHTKSCGCYRIENNKKRHSAKCQQKRIVMKEEWKDIPGYEGLYQASSLGRIKSLPRSDEIPRWKGCSTIRKQFIKNKYYQVNLSKDGKTRWHAVHRLVAIAFLPNPNNYPQVNHKDEIQTNNNVSNLEWCDQKYNMNYGTVKHRISHSKLTRDYKTKVIQIKDGKPIAVFNSSYDAQRKTGIEHAAICKVCRGTPKYKTAGGYEWRRVNIGDPILFNLTR